MSGVLLAGCDFSSSPSARKPIVVALGSERGGRVSLTSLLRFNTLADWRRWLGTPGPWVCGFDFPFGLPRELATTLGWPLEWEASIRHYAAMERADIREDFVGFCAARPVGGKFAHRATDVPAGSSPSMKWVNPPVAWMLHAGAPALLEAGVHIPGLHEGDAAEAAANTRRVALEAYPGLLARELLARRSYKSDTREKQTPDRLIARNDLLSGLEVGRTRLGLRLRVSHAQRDTLLADASGDSLDAVLCLMQAAWAERQHADGAPRYGLPADIDPLEGWIVTV